MEQLRRHTTIEKANAGYITVREAAEALGISERQVQRLKKGVREQGPAAIISRKTMIKPKHALPDNLREQILQIRSKPGFKDSNIKHFQELLEVHHSIKISYSALYRLLASEGIKSPMKRRRFKPHRRRKRRPQAGSLVQIDASSYDWFGIGTNYTLHGAIDDATGQVTGLFMCKNECMLGHFEVMRRMISIFGVPDAVYADRHTIFRSPNADKAKREDTPAEIRVNETQFGRALSELRIQIIAARSPQAKGRIERLWGTLQSRLPVELEIAGIKDIETANEFLADYIFSLNSEFAVEPIDYDSAFLPLDEAKNLDYILCVKEERILDRGQVFSYKGRSYQIAKSPYSSYIPIKAKVTVMVSPRIGIAVGYRNHVFTTLLTQKRKTVAENEPEVVTPSTRTYKAGMPFSFAVESAWLPGTPSYSETLEIITEIFNRPYSTPRGTSH